MPQAQFTTIFADHETLGNQTSQGSCVANSIPRTSLDTGKAESPDVALNRVPHLAGPADSGRPDPGSVEARTTGEDREGRPIVGTRCATRRSCADPRRSYRS